MNIILLAPPAAGKGTQSNLLEKHYNLNHISTGDLLREAASEDTDFGKEIKGIMESGKLVTDDIVIEVFNNYLDKATNTNLLLDGFPRNIYQALKLDEILDNKNSKIDYVFLLNVSKDILADRITGRRLCKSCGTIYNVNIESLKPSNDNVCDKCGNNLTWRSDDNYETFETRYNEYLEQTSPLIEYYRGKDVLYEIDGEGTTEEIFNRLKEIINN
jgi:adenylate kinase